MKWTRSGFPWFVLAVLSVAFLLTRTSFFNVLPLPFFQPDSGSYLKPACSFLSGGSMNLSFDRTPGYPAFIFSMLVGAGSFSRLLVVQHLLLLLIGVIAAVLVRRFFSRSLVAAFLVAGYVVFHPRLFIYAHSIMTEILYTAAVITSILLLYSAESKKHWALWAGAGLAAGAALLVRPVGWSLVPAFVVWTLWAGRTKNHFKGLAVMGGAWFAIVGSVMMFNFLFKGFFGLCRIGSFALFGSYAFLLPLEKVPDMKVRQVLSPIYAARPPELRELNWVVYNSSGPVKALEKITENDNELADTVGSLTRLAITSHPLSVVQRIADRATRFVVHASRRPKYLFPKEYAYANGIIGLCQQRAKYLSVGDWFPCHTAELQAEIDRIKSIPLYPFEKTKWTPSLIWWLITGAGIWVPIAAIFAGIGLCFYRDSLKPALLLLLTVGGTIFLTAVSQDLDGRYTIPVEPLYAVLLAAFVEKGALRLFSLLKSRS